MSRKPISESLAGKKILLTGSTGFLGKVFLSALLKQYPEVGEVVALVRADSHQAARDRFVRDVLTSPTFDPLREEHGIDLYEFVTSKVTVYRGDLVKDQAGLDDEALEAVTKDLDLVIHSAGLVDFVPPLDKALDINVRGTLNCLELAKRASRDGAKSRCGFVHVSTCFVCGSREGQHQEALDPHDYPKRTHSGFKGFNAAEELRTAWRLVEEIKNDEANDPALQADLWEEAGGNKRKVKRLTDLHIRRRMVEVGIERARRWGWPNTYTYSKALAERLVHEASGDLGAVATVRPAVVESAVGYPFPGWNQGINTSAPLVWMTAQGQRYWPSSPDVFLDVIPVDFVAHALIAIGAAVVDGDAEDVYQLGSSDKNPFAMRRIIELASLAYRDRKHESPLLGFLRKKLDLDSMTVPKRFYEKYGMPGKGRLAKRIKKAIERIPDPVERPRLRDLLHSAKTTLKTAVRDLDRAEQVIEIYLPFIRDCPVTFRCDRSRRLYADLTPEDQAKIPYTPLEIDWRDYWVNVHIPGLERWAFPQLRLQAGGAPSGFEPEFDSLTALFEDRARFGRIVLWRRLNAEGKVAAHVTYEEALARSRAAAGRLIALGVKPGDRVVLLSENAPEWGLGYFGILICGATAVPLENGIEAKQAMPMIEASGAKVVLLSRSNRDVSGEGLTAALQEKGLAAQVRALEEMVAPREKQVEQLPDLPIESELVPRAPASLIYTSGTTGAPKGVLLSHLAFCRQVRALASIFRVGSDDRILSVLPLHHCFEFSAGFLLPLYGGATVTYLPETTPESIRTGLEAVRPTTMIGVPALFEAWHRKVRRKVKAKGVQAERAYEALLAFHRGFRARTKINLGKKLFPEVHEAFGGALRFVVSGGAALSLEVALEFQGLGLDIYEGYGLTEAGPVISANRPDDPVVLGSVGQAIPGVEIRIHEPDGEGVGEILARSPCLCSGYDGDPQQTRRILRDGWLHTGDLGRLDADDCLHVVGRLKDAIVDASGNTVHPDEVEDLYSGCADVAELAVAGVSRTGSDHDVVAALFVPRTDVEGGAVGARERIREFVQQLSETIPYPKRIKMLHFTNRSLPRTQTRKVKRQEVAHILNDLALSADTGRRRPRRGGRKSQLSRAGVDVARIFEEEAGIDASRVVPTADLMQDLGLDSIALAEVTLALAEAFEKPAPRSLTQVNTVASLLSLFESEGGEGAAAPITAEARPVDLPEPLKRAGSNLLDRLQEVGYGRILKAKITGRGNIPHHTNAIVVANHCSHLDVGLVKYALGEYGQGIVSAAARDYFFRDTLRASYFENFTSVVAFDRHESVRKSLGRFVGLLRQGKQVVIFPEGTRSLTGRMGAFKPGLGLLVQASQTGVLPIYLFGTHKSMPKGTWLPKVEPLEARIGPFLPPDKLLERTRHLPRRQQANRIVEIVRRSLCALRDGEGFDFDRELPVGGDAAEGPKSSAQPAPVAEHTPQDKSE